MVCCPNETIKAFFTRIAGELPVSILAEENDGRRTITEPEKIEEICQFVGEMRLSWSFDGISFPRVIERDQLPESSYTFVMADGSEYVFRFFGKYLCVEYPEPFGTWGYYVDELIPEAGY